MTVWLDDERILTDMLALTIGHQRRLQKSVPSSDDWDTSYYRVHSCSFLRRVGKFGEQKLFV
jgi:hypothetical protein